MINSTVLREQYQLAEICARMSDHGIRIDTDRLAIVRKEIESEKLAISDGYTLNLKSPKQLKEFFTKQYGFNIPDTKKDTFLTYSEKYPQIREFKDIYDYKQIGKGADAWYSDKHLLNGSLHPRWNPIGTSERRLSCSKPNFQNVPHRDSLFASRMRSVVIPRRNSVLVEIDASAGEDWSTAFAAKDDKLWDRLKSGDDVHAATASYVYGIYDCWKDGFRKCKCHKWEREVGKRCNHMHKYGQGFKYVQKNDLKKLSKMHKDLDSGMGLKGWEGDGYFVYFNTARMAEIIKEFTPEQSRFVLPKAKELAVKCKQQLLEDYSGIKLWQQRVFEGWLNTGSVSNPYGFERKFYGEPEVCAKRAFAFIGASTLQTVVIRGMIDIYSELNIVPCAQIHDSNLYDDFPVDKAAATAEQCKLIFERDRNGLSVPWEIKTANNNWSEMG